MTQIYTMPTAAGDGIKLKKYGDILFPNLDIADPVTGIKYAKELEYRTGDILLCTYPKSGSHWMANMMWKLNTFDNSKRPKDAMLEFGPPEVFENMESPRIMFTHQVPSRLPTQHIKNGGKIVLMFRNPKDICVSFYQHLKNAAMFLNSQTWDEFFDAFINGLLPMGSYFDYVEQWEMFLKEQSSSDSVEVFYYEDCISNLDANIARLNKFLGFNRDQAYIEKVKAETTIKALKEQDASGKRGIQETVRDIHGDSVIYRKGVVGDWKNYLTMAQSEMIDKIMAERLQYGILDIKYSI